MFRHYGIVVLYRQTPRTIQQNLTSALKLKGALHAPLLVYFKPKPVLDFLVIETPRSQPHLAIQ